MRERQGTATVEQIASPASGACYAHISLHCAELLHDSLNQVGYLPIVLQFQEELDRATLRVASKLQEIVDDFEGAGVD